ncbi:MAG: UDP-galactose transporter [Cirrosporium novae-zelandiae]|nr:MAG: UDP-galactose transporter [Cirrosporium novae-zelandiae]
MSAKTRQMNGAAKHHANGVVKGFSANGVAVEPSSPPTKAEAGFVQLVLCVGGIYASFLTWAALQERITTTPHGDPASPEQFTFSVFLNTVQSTLAALSGYLYLLYTRRSSKGTNTSVFPTRSILPPLILVSITSSLASPFGYASLNHVDYITFILAKSCKLLPVMFLHLTIFRKRYPLYKYAVVALVTAGVAIFTLNHPPSGKKKSSSLHTGNSVWGLFLLGINLLFDGLTNSTQDHIFTAFRPFTGPQMMVAQNLLSTLLQLSYLLLGAFPVPILSALLPTTSASAPAELPAALTFLTNYPSVLKDVLLFSLCGAIGQIFIYVTLERFSSVLLVTVTVTRKMLTMVLSVIWFGHRLSGMQWVGVGLVFGGIGGEALMKMREKKGKGKKKE